MATTYLHYVGNITYDTSIMYNFFPFMMLGTLQDPSDVYLGLLIQRKPNGLSYETCLVSVHFFIFFKGRHICTLQRLSTITSFNYLYNTSFRSIPLASQVTMAFPQNLSSVQHVSQGCQIELFKGIVHFRQSLFLEGSLDGKLITRCDAAETPNNQLYSEGNLAASVQSCCTATTGEIKHYTVLIHINGLFL